MYDFAAGITHPLLGFDHFLVMAAVGVIAVQKGRRMTWTLPIVFITAIIIGGVLGINAFGLPMVETAIALSVLVFGALIALAKKLPNAAAFVSVAIFALFHGHAHGTEMVASNALFYTSGFILATALMHLIGIVIGLNAKKTILSLNLLKTSGAAISVVGLFLLLNL